jgi:hypothetical protein
MFAATLLPQLFALAISAKSPVVVALKMLSACAPGFFRVAGCGGLLLPEFSSGKLNTFGAKLGAGG